MFKKLVFALSMFLCSSSFAQQVDWLETGGGTGFDGGLGIAVDQNGNNYSVGFVSPMHARWGTDTISINASYDGYIVKHDVRGRRKWVFSFGGTNVDAFSGIKMLGDTSILVVGTYRGPLVTLGTQTLPTPPSGGANLVVARLDTAGTLEWVKTAEIGNTFFSPWNNFYNPQVDVNDQGEIIVAGSYRGSAKFGSVSLTTGGTFIFGSFVAKYLKDGTFKWVKNLSGTTNTFGTRVTVDQMGNSYISGNFNATVTIGGVSLTSSGSRDIYLTKIDTAGNFKWAKKIGGTNFDEAYGIAIDKFNHLYLSGRFWSQMTVGSSSLNTNPGVNNNSDAFLVRLDTSGSYVWGKAFGGFDGTYVTQDFCYGTEVDDKGNVGISGRFGGSGTKFGNDTINGNGNFRAIFISLVDSSGDFTWTITGTTTGTFFNNQSNGIALDTNKNIYSTGVADPPLVFGDKAWSINAGGGQRDAYVVKIADCSEATKAEIYTGLDSTACQGDSVKLWSNNLPNLEYRWLRSGFGLFQAIDSTYKAYVTDDYSLAVNDEGCLDTSGSIRITINQPTTPSLNNFPPTCAGGANFKL